MVLETDGRRDEEGGKGERVEPEVKPAAKPKPKPRKKEMPIVIIGRRGLMTVFQKSADDLRIYGVPTSVVDPDKSIVLEADYNGAERLDVEWEDYIEPITIEPAAMAEALRRIGIYTVADFEKNQAAAKVAFRQCGTQTMIEVYQRAKRAKEA